ncbi:MAG: glycosyltransferase family 4 protein [Acidobacteriota bacterium]|nr:MAG: glycosyltransferase family 4 protein [Acidobacteriota bacterium]
MRIVFFNRSYYPDMGATGQLLTELTQDLVREHGCDVTVVCGPTPGFPSGIGSHEGVTIVRAKGTQLARRGFFGRFTNYLSYFLAAAWASLRLPRADIVVALTDPPIIGLVAWATSKRMGARFVFLCQDIFPEVANLLEDFRSETINAVLQRVNCFLVKRADRVIALGDAMKGRLVSGKNADPERVSVIHNWADTEAIAPAAKDNAFSREHGLADKFVVMHSGNIGLSQNLDCWIEVASRFASQPDIVFLLIGDGVRREALGEDVVRRGLDNVLFLPYQPRNALRDSYATADVFIVSLKPGLAGYIVPSKLYGILAAGRPYVAAVEPATEVAAISREYDCGVVVAPGDVGGMVHEITRFQRDRERCERLGRNARRAGVHFDRRKQVRAYRELFRVELVESRPRAHAACEARS